MRRVWITVLGACIGLASSATVLGGDLMSATGAVIAIVNGDLFVGEAEGHLSGAGTLNIHSQQDPALTCLGQFTSTAELGGSGQMRCSDGSAATFHFQRLTMFCGHGVGNFSRGPMSFAYGLSPEEAKPYLKLPAGKKLAHNGTELELVALAQ